MARTLASNESVESLFIEEETIEESTTEPKKESLVGKVSVEPAESLPIEVVVAESVESTKKFPIKETMSAENDEEKEAPENTDVESGKQKNDDAPSDDKGNDALSKPPATSKSTWIDWMMQRKKQLLIVLGFSVLVFIIAVASGSTSSRKNSEKANAVETAQSNASTSMRSVPTLLPTPRPETLPISSSQPIFLQEPTLIEQPFSLQENTTRPTFGNDDVGTLFDMIQAGGPIPVAGKPAPTSPTLHPTYNPTASPTTLPPTNTPTAQPTQSPTNLPTATPTMFPTKRPTNTPTVSPTTIGPTDSARPTIDFPLLIDDFLEEFHDANIERKDWKYNPSSMAVDWIADENTPDSIKFDDKLVQRFSLLALDFSLQKAKKGWELPMNGEKHVDECNWRGIHCDQNGLVEKIEWSYLENSKKGLITPEIKHLRSLKHLDLSNNLVEKEIPGEFYELTNLESVYLDNNQLKGSISTQIGNLKALKYFNLAGNKKLWGSIPSEIGLCEELIYFNAYSNQLSGNLPENLKLKNLWYFDVGRNYLSGTLPDDLGKNLRGLRHLHLDHNEFVGTLPFSYNMIGNGRLETFSINHNQLTGVVLGERKMYNKLVQYTLQNNYFNAMEPDVCRSEIPFGEMVELRANCDICSCVSKFFNICDRMCYNAPSSSPTMALTMYPTVK